MGPCGQLYGKLHNRHTKNQHQWSSSEPTNLVALPAANTINSFGFNWDAPVTYVGNVSNIVYCYTVNVAPSGSNCNYTATGSTELTVGPYATQPGVNTLYVVAVMNQAI